MNIFERIEENNHCCLKCNKGCLEKRVVAKIVHYVCTNCGTIHTQNAYKCWIPNPDKYKKEVSWTI